MALSDIHYSSSSLANLYNRTEITEKQVEEQLLRDNPSRWVILPIKFPSLWALFKAHELEFWTAEDITYSNDCVDCADKLVIATGSSDLMSFVCKKVQDFVVYESVSDLSVYGGLGVRSCELLQEIQVPEARAFYGFQCAACTIHVEACCMLLQAYSSSKYLESDQQRILSSPAVEAKMKWAEGSMNPAYPFCEKLVVHAITRTIFNAARSILIGWCETNGVFPSLTSVYHHVIDDERLHAHFCVGAYALLEHQVPYGALQRLVSWAVEIEYQFALEMLPLSATKIEKEKVYEYLTFISTKFLNSFSPSMTPQPANCPLSFLSELILPIPLSTRPVKESIAFERRQKSNYCDPKSTTDVSADVGLSLDEDF